MWKGNARLFFWSLLACFLWATNYIVTRWGLAEVPPLTLTGVRYLLASLILIPFMGLRGDRQKNYGPGRIWPILVYGLFATAGAFGFLTVSMTVIGSGRASIITNTHPFYTLIVARLFLQEEITGRKILSLCLGFMGIFLVLSPELGGRHSHPLGNLFALFAALCFSAANSFGQKISPGYDTRVLTAGQMLAGALLLLGISTVLEVREILQISLYGWMAISYLAVFSSLLPFLIWIHLLKFYEASTLSLFVFSIPLLASLLSFLIFRERFSLSTLCGLALITCGLLLIREKNGR
ncbi:MAG: EamA family transporter [Proteobacteria bacterium]|nr:EamA family transporter [Pseudomonadota bacterium]